MSGVVVCHCNLCFLHIFTFDKMSKSNTVLWTVVNGESNLRVLYITHRKSEKANDFLVLSHPSRPN